MLHAEHLSSVILLHSPHFDFTSLHWWSAVTQQWVTAAHGILTVQNHSFMNKPGLLKISKTKKGFLTGTSQIQGHRKEVDVYPKCGDLDYNPLLRVYPPLDSLETTLPPPHSRDQSLKKITDYNLAKFFNPSHKAYIASKTHPDILHWFQYNQAKTIIQNKNGEEN
jgi:hypothetical protein